MIDLKEASKGLTNNEITKVVTQATELLIKSIQLRRSNGKGTNLPRPRQEEGDR